MYHLELEKIYTILTINKNVEEILQVLNPEDFCNKKDLIFNYGIVDLDFLKSSFKDELRYIKFNLGFFKKTLDIERLIKLDNIFYNKSFLSMSYSEKLLASILINLYHLPRYLVINQTLSRLSHDELKFFKKLLKRINKLYKTTIIIITDKLDNGMDNYLLLGTKVIGSKEDILKYDNELLKQGIKIDTMTRISILLRDYEISPFEFNTPDELVGGLW